MGGAMRAEHSRGSSKKKAEAKPAAVQQVVESLAEEWRKGPLRDKLRRATNLTDAQLDEALASPECAAALERMWRVVLREASLALLVSIVGRAEKESSVAKLMTDLCGMGAPTNTAGAAPENPEADFNAFERAILDNLRAAVNERLGGAG